MAESSLAKSPRSLRTEALGMADALAAAEALRPGESKRFAHLGDLLGAAVLTADFAPLPLQAFDRVGPRLDAVQQAAWFHLLRLSFGAGRNFCRVPKRELRSRLRLSERRLNRVLDQLDRAGTVRALHRDNRGTLYRVFLPDETEGRSPEGVLLGSPCELSDPHPSPPTPLGSARKAGP